MEEKSFEDYWAVINHTPLTQLYFWSQMQDWQSTRKCPICQVTGGCLSRHSLWPLLETGSRARSVFGLTQCSHSGVLVKIRHCYKAHSNCSHLNSSYTILNHEYTQRTQVQKSLTFMEEHVFSILVSSQHYGCCCGWTGNFHELSWPGTSAPSWGGRVCQWYYSSSCF